MCLGNADEGMGFSLLQTSLEVFGSHAGIDQHRHRTDFEQGKGQGEKVEARLDHQDRPDPALNADRFQCQSNAVTVTVEVGEAVTAIAQFSVLLAPTGYVDSRDVRLKCRHFGQMGSDIVTEDSIAHAFDDPCASGLRCRKLLTSGTISSPA